MTVWHPDLPQAPAPGSWSERGEQNYIESEPEIGAPVRRAVQTSAGALATGDFMMTQAQLLIFLNMYEVDLQNGTLSYQWMHPIRGILYYWRIEEPPNYTSMTLDAHRVSLSLRRMA